MQHATTVWHKWVTAEVNFYKKWRNDCHMGGGLTFKKNFQLTEAVITPVKKTSMHGPYGGTDKTFGRGFKYIKINIQNLIFLLHWL